VDTVDNGDIVVSINGFGTDIEYGTANWVAQNVVDNLNSVLTVANIASTYTPPVLHAIEIAPVESRLRIATQLFNPQPTSPENAQPDMTVLTDACDELDDLVNPLIASQNNGADVTAGVIWVPLAKKTALLNDIATARTASYSTHADVLAKIDDLKDSLIALLDLREPGSKSNYILATSRKFPDGFVGAAYSAQLVDATLPNVAFSVSSGTLPTGLSLDASSTGVTPTGTGKLIGKPMRAGTFNFTIQATHNSITPAVTETFSHTIKIYDAPAVVPTELDPLGANLVSIQSDIVIHFPFAVPMKTDVLGTVTLNGQPIGGYWTTDTTFVIPHPIDYYEYETDYVIVVIGLESKDELLTYDYRYAFRTIGTTPVPPVPHAVTLLSLDGVVSDPLPGQYWIGPAENYSFTLRLTVPPDKTPTLVTNRIVNGEIETLTGVPDPGMPETRFLFSVLQIHQPIEISVALSPRSVGNEIVGDGVRVWASGGKLYVETPQSGWLSVYNIAGVMQVRKPIVDSSVISLPKGIYIVHLNGKTYKVAVP
jgi:hypothetical protein